MKRVLVIDDDEDLRDTVGAMLESEGFAAILAADGKVGLGNALSLNPDLLLVDLRLPVISGFDICRKLRAAAVQTPIIVLSAISDEIDKVLLFELGADDYIVKPFGSRELLARVRAVLRRTSPKTQELVSFSNIQIDLERCVITCGGKDLRLTPAEFKLLAFFVNNADKVLTRDTILNSVWGYESYPNTRTVDAHVGRLRQKLESEPGVPRHFVTVHGVGYRFLL